MSEMNVTKSAAEGNGELQPEAQTTSRLPEETLNPFDPARLALSQDFAASVGVEKKLITVPVRKPSKEWFVRVHPDLDMQIKTGVIELKEDRDIFIIDPSLWSALSMESTFSPRLFVTAINRQGVLFLWPLRLPKDDSGRRDEWMESSFEAVRLAREGWVRVSANMSLGAYEVCTAPDSTAEPDWPDKTLMELLEIAFKNRLIDDLDHTVLRQLRGEV